MLYKNSDYEIYEDGRCFSYKSNKFMKPQMTNKYPTYNLTIDGKKKKIMVHRMVAETYLPLIEGKNIVNHIDGNTHNFSLENLEWVSSSENAIHARKMGLLPKGNQNAIYYTGDLNNEKWIAVKNYPNYQVSSCGRVMNINTKRLLKPCISNHGYYYVNLYKNNQGYTSLVHQLVFNNFYQDSNEVNNIINHIDGNKLNNNLENLESISRSENNLHAVYQIKTHRCNKVVIQLDQDNNEIQTFNSVSEAYKLTGINNISRAATTGKTAGGYKWKYLND